MASFPRYGAKGVKVCARWRTDFAAFVADMGERPEGHTLDRIDSSGDYTPDNCRWLDAAENSGRDSRKPFGGWRSISDLAKSLGARSARGAAYHSRLACGWCPGCAATVPVGQPRPQDCPECPSATGKPSAQCVYQRQQRGGWCQTCAATVPVGQARRVDCPDCRPARGKSAPSQAVQALPKAGPRRRSTSATAPHRKPVQLSLPLGSPPGG